jgi:hypothetical protein
MGKESEKIDHPLTPPSSISRTTLTACGLLTRVEVLIEVKEKAENEEGNWTMRWSQAIRQEVMG